MLVRVSGRSVLRVGRVLAACWPCVGRVLAACWPRGMQLLPARADFFLKQPLVPGSFAAWGRTVFYQKSDFFEEATCPGQLRCLRQNFFSEFRFF